MRIPPPDILIMPHPNLLHFLDMNPTLNMMFRRAAYSEEGRHITRLAMRIKRPCKARISTLQRAQIATNIHRHEIFSIGADDGAFVVFRQPGAFIDARRVVGPSCFDCEFRKGWVIGEGGKHV